MTTSSGLSFRASTASPSRQSGASMPSSARSSTHALVQRRPLLVGGEVRMDRAIGAELAEPEDRLARTLLLEQRLQLVAQARGREVADEPHLDAAAGEPLRVRLEPQPVAALVPDRAEDPRRVVDEREVVEDAQRAPLEVAAAAERIDEAAEILRRERDGHRVQREVAPEEILADRRTLDRRERRRRVVELRAGRDEIDALAVAVRDRGRAELLMRANVAAERLREQVAERDGITLDRDVDVEPGLAEQDVAHGAADEVDALGPLAERGDRLRDRREPLERARSSAARDGAAATSAGPAPRAPAGGRCA